MPVDTALVLDLLIAIGIGGLIGLEREQSASAGFVAGSRTLPLVALLGAVLQAFYPAAVWVGLAGVLLLALLAYAAKVLIEGDPGMTTAVATVLTFVFGAMIVHSATGRTLGVVLGTATTVLLASKGRLHDLADRIDETERQAMVKFLIVGLIILPLLPDRSIDLLLGLNPRFVWLMVVFVSGIGLAGYLLVRLLGAHRGLGLTGLLGGLVSSTATTVSMAERVRDAPGLYGACGFAAVLASLVMLPRVLLEVAVVNRALLVPVLIPVGTMLVVGVGLAGLVYWRTKRTTTVEPELDNPFSLGPALIFAGLFALILLASEHLHAWFGDPGLYGTALLSGVADVDAITLSVSRLAAEGTIAEPVAVTGIVLAITTNTVVKAGIAWAMGTRRLGALVAIILGLSVGAGLGALILL